jgi:hypothetical protein
VGGQGVPDVIHASLMPWKQSRHNFSLTRIA